MSERELYLVFPYLFGSALILGGFLFLLSLFLLQRRRTGSNYRLRRRAGERGGRLFILSLVLLVVGAIMAAAWLMVSVVYQADLVRPIERGEDDLYGIDVPIETLDALTSQALTPTDTPTFTPSASFTPSDTPTPTPSFTITHSPTATATPLLLATNTPRRPMPTRARPTPPTS